MKLNKVKRISLLKLKGSSASGRRHWFAYRNSFFLRLDKKAASGDDQPGAFVKVSGLIRLHLDTVDKFNQIVQLFKIVDAIYTTYC